MINSLDQFHFESEMLVKAFNDFAHGNYLLNKAKADHICYKCGSADSFERIIKLFHDASNYIYQSIISKRRIAYIKMKRPVNTALGDIVFLELSDQKPDLSQVDGFDHIEVYPVTMNYEEMISHLESNNKVIKVERPHHTTHDIELDGGFVWRATRGPLIEKIKVMEMI